MKELMEYEEKKEKKRSEKREEEWGSKEKVNRFNIGHLIIYILF
jgi:hypothetical protein